MRNITVFFSFVTISLLTITLRYPSTETAIGSDTFEYTVFINSLIDNGHAKWIINPLSYFGLYPASDSGGHLFYISLFPVITGLSTNISVYLVVLYISLLFNFIIFILAKEIIPDKHFALNSALIFCAIPLFVRYTTWQATPRIVSVFYLFLIFFFLLRTLKSTDLRFRFLGIITLIITLSIHKLGLIGLVFIFFYIIVRYYLSLNFDLNLKFIYNNSNRTFLFSLICMLLFSIISLHYLREGYSNEVRIIVENSVSIGNMMSFVIHYVGFYGASLILGVIGIYHSIEKSYNIDILSFIPLVILLTFGSILVYIDIFFSLPLIFLASFGSYNLNTNGLKKLQLILVFLMILQSMQIDKGEYKDYLSPKTKEELSIRPQYITSTQMQAIIWSDSKLDKGILVSNINVGAIASYSDHKILLSKKGMEIIYDYVTIDQINSKTKITYSSVFSLEFFYLEMEDMFFYEYGSKIYNSESDSYLVQLFKSQQSSFVIVNDTNFESDSLLINSTKDNYYTEYSNNNLEISII